MIVQTLLIAIGLTIATAFVLRTAMRSESSRSDRLLWGGLYVLLVGLIIAALILGYSVDPGWVGHYTREGGFVETITFWLQLIAGGIFLRVVLRSSQAKLNLVAVALAGLAFVIAGEEVAWGQHIFHFDPPESVKAVNRQGETTVHNLMVGGVYIGSWLQAAAPGLLVAGLLAWQVLFPKAAQMYGGFGFNPHIAVLLGLVALFIFHGAYPFDADVDAPVALGQLPLEIFRSHSSPQSELSECLLGYVMLVAALALDQNQSKARARDSLSGVAYEQVAT
jgi:hypothetical protein